MHDLHAALRYGFGIPCPGRGDRLGGAVNGEQESERLCVVQQRGGHSVAAADFQHAVTAIGLQPIQRKPDAAG